MAAELTYTNGVANIFSVKETPWHREGHVLSGAPTWDDAFTLGGLDYPMEKRPYLMPADDGSYVEARDAFYVSRTDTKKVLGSVGGQYEIVANRDAFAPLRPLVDEGLLTLETGGVLRDGRDAWIMGKWALDRFGDKAREVFGNEQILPFATVLANHSGRRGILMGQTPIRVVCANTLGAAERNGLSRWATVDHRAGAKARLVEAAREMFSRIVERYEVIAEQYDLLAATMLDGPTFSRLVLDVIAPDPRQHRDWNPEAKMAAAVVLRSERKRGRLTELWTSGKGHTGMPSAWFAYNGAVEALDYDRELWPTRAGCYRTASLLDGDMATLKNRVLDNLVSYAQGA